MNKLLSIPRWNKMQITLPYLKLKAWMTSKTYIILMEGILLMISCWMTNQRFSYRWFILWKSLSTGRKMPTPESCPICIWINFLEDNSRLWKLYRSLVLAIPPSRRAWIDRSLSWSMARVRQAPSRADAPTSPLQVHVEADVDVGYPQQPVRQVAHAPANAAGYTCQETIQEKHKFW